MARDYGKIETGFWQNPNIRRLSQDAKDLLIYLFTSSQSNACGTYVLPLLYVVSDMDWDEKRVALAFHELSLKPHALWDRQSQIVHVPGWWGHNQIDNPKVAIHVAKVLRALPDCSLKMRAAGALNDQKRFVDEIAKVFKGWSYHESQPALPFLNVTNLPLLPEPPVKKVRLGTRITADWQPDDDMLTYAAEKGLSTEQVESEIVKFVRYFTGADAKEPSKKDWLRTWQNWIDKAATSRPSNGNGHANGSSYNFGVAEVPWKARVTGFRQNGLWLSSWGPEPGQPGFKGPPDAMAPAD